MKTTYQVFLAGCLTILVTSFTSCKKLVEDPAPVTSINAENVFTNDANAISAITNIYINMVSGSDFESGLSGISYIGGLSADELTLWNGISNSAQNWFYANSLTVQNYSANYFWSPMYSDLFAINSAIIGLTGNNNLTPAVQRQLLGEAYFLRGFYYFYLVNMYGNVPLVTGIDYKVNESLGRAPKAQVYQQIVSDLLQSKGLLSNNFLGATLQSSTTKRVRPTRWAAMAMLSRTYLYNKDYANAKIYADSLISNDAPFNLSLIPNLNMGDPFLANSNEAIWQLQPVSVYPSNTLDGSIFVIPGTGPNYNQNVYLSSSLLNSFEPGDQRRINWVNSVAIAGTTYYYPFKYQVGAGSDPVTEYTMVLRLAEQYLIRAEAEANNAGVGISAAINDLNIIRNRAGLPNYTGAMDESSVLSAIIHERQVEFFSEWGQRWFDLKRTGTIDVVMTAADKQKSLDFYAAPGQIVWKSYQQLYPIPLTDLQKDSKLVQNPGY